MHERGAITCTFSTLWRMQIHYDKVIKTTVPVGSLLQINTEISALLYFSHYATRGTHHAVQPIIFAITDHRWTKTNDDP